MGHRMKTYQMLKETAVIKFSVYEMTGKYYA